MKILVTGSQGFIGKHFIKCLESNSPHKIMACTHETSPKQLADFLLQCDFIYHFAGVNRSVREEDFYEGNVHLLKNMLVQLKRRLTPCPLVLSSSIHAVKETPYGKTKRLAETAAFQYAEETGAPVWIYRLPNVFGEGSRPNYNSVVATFCHNVMCGLPLIIHDPDVTLHLVYIGELVDTFIRLLTFWKTLESGYREHTPIYKIQLPELAALLKRFYEFRCRSLTPPLETAFEQMLYRTFLSFAPGNPEMERGMPV